MISKQPSINLPRILTLAAIYVVLSLIIILNIRSIQPALHELLDFGSFIAAGKEAVAGKNPYSVDSPLVYRLESHKTGQSLPSPNLNPPLSILFFIPLAKMDPLRAVSAWRILSVILFGIGVFLLTFFYPQSKNPPRILWAITLVGFWQMIALGQIYAPILILAIGTWVLTAKGSQKLAGLALGAIIAIKPNFAFWLILLGATGYITAAFTAAITALAFSIPPLLIFGVRVYQDWLAALLNYPSLGLLIAGNTSFQSLTARLGSAAVGTMISILFIGGSLYFGNLRKFSLNRVNTLGIVGSLLISPFSWAGYTILTLPIFLSRSQWNWWLKISAALLAFPYPLVLYFFQKTFFHSVVFGSLYGWALLLVVTDLILNDEHKSITKGILISAPHGGTEEMT